MGIPLHYPTEEIERNFWEMIQSFPHVTQHLINFAIQRGSVHTETIHIGRKEKMLIYYTRAHSTFLGRKLESFYIATPKRAVSITYGHPSNTGVLEVVDLPASLALQELSEVQQGISGSSFVRAHLQAPHPQAFYGIANFRKETIKKVLPTLETLFELGQPE